MKAGLEGAGAGDRCSSLLFRGPQILLGPGVRIWDGLEDLDEDYRIESASSPSGVTYVTFTRAGL
ncbi:hypothetical protein ACFV29_39645 [Streptomyces sp. NPDC059690]|uniref:hypothetical protein n=1 Tax=Streptomyces sp. NPDC059690 TaxID=3346907 RepID=UPI003675572F